VTDGSDRGRDEEQPIRTGEPNRPWTKRHAKGAEQQNEESQQRERYGGRIGEPVQSCCGHSLWH
jgi:hypothetical protein